MVEDEDTVSIREQRSWEGVVMRDTYVLVLVEDVNSFYRAHLVCYKRRILCWLQSW